MNKEVFFSLNEANFSVGKKHILRNINFSIHKNDKIAVVGKNGVGKSTLLKVIKGIYNIDEGEIWSNPKIKTGLLAQRNNANNNLEINEYLNSLRLDDAKPKIENIINEVKLDRYKKIKDLSGGEKRKLALSELLILGSDLLLLDEPTNHLDIESIQWLQDFLNNKFIGSFLVISHNRNFLKNVTNKVFWMDRGFLKISSKGFYNFEDWKNLLIEQEKRELKNKKKFLEEEVSWLNRGIKARRKRNERRKENIYNLKNTYEIENKEFLRSISKIKIPNESIYTNNGPNILINFMNVDKNFFKKDDEIKILKNFNFKLIRGEKIGIVGKNGSGKSTFLNLASGKIQPDKGGIKIRKHVDFSFFDQTGEQFDDSKTLKKNLIPSGGDYVSISDKKIHICGYLKNFLFDHEDIDRPLSTLSGGERNRLLLAKILSTPREILILDEPTNDLDIETIDLLIDFINLHNGSALVSSHDIDFLQKTCKRFLFFDNSGKPKLLNMLPSTIKTEDFKKKINIKQKKIKPLSHAKLIDKILRKIENKEKEILLLTNQLQNQMGSNKEIMDKNLLDKLKESQSELEFLEKEWVEIEEKSMNND